MKKQTFDLIKMGFAPMSELEMQEIDGGSFWNWLAAGGFVAAIVGIVTMGTGLVGVGIIAISIGLAGGNN
jgi:hypothetical protein